MYVFMQTCLAAAAVRVSNHFSPYFRILMKFRPRVSVAANVNLHKSLNFMFFFCLIFFPFVFLSLNAFEFECLMYNKLGRLSR